MSGTYFKKILKRLSIREWIGFTAIIVLVFILFGVDFISDINSELSWEHLALDFTLLGLLLFAVVRVIILSMHVREKLQDEHSVTLKSIGVAHDEILRRKLGLSAEVDRQFDLWRFTGAEKDVAWLLVKGLSSKEIASIRGSSEKTVRQQSLAIYSKAKVSGRAELAAFFLEDWLAGDEKLSSHDVKSDEVRADINLSVPHSTNH